MMTNVGKRLQQNIPEFIQDSPELMSYLAATGEFLQDTKDGITAFDWSSDYKYGTNYNARSSLRDLGYSIPPNTDPDTYRQVLRDALVALVTKGTTSSILWVLRIIGVTPEIREAWLPASDDVEIGYIVDPYSGERTRYDVDRFSYGEMLYGDVEVTDGGVFFNGSRYEDIFNENMTGLLPIKGETYSTRPDGYATYVEKMPYIIIRITNESFNIVTDGFVDPETGEEYEYDNNEQYKAVETLIEFFLQQTARPANVRILIVSSVQELEDALEVADTFEQESTDDEVDILENYQISDVDSTEFNYATLEDPLVIGDPMFIGQTAPSPLFNSLPGGGVYVDEINQTTNFEIELAEDYVGFSVTTYEKNLRASNEGLNRIPVLHKMDVTLTAPSDVAVGIYALNNFNDNRTIAELLETIQPDQTSTVRVEYPKRAFFVRAVDDTDSAVEINIDYIGYSTND